MAEIEITLPTIQYGNIKITATPEEWGLESIADAPDVGVWAATYLNLFQQGFQHGAQVGVYVHLGGSQPVTEEQARRYLDEGLGGTTEVENEESPTDQAGAPWDRPAPAVSKPWENPEASNPPVLDDVW
jgi:hypothetical protein